MKYDVVIVGGGISGSIAAIACARMNVKTLLIEEKGCLGGALTSSGTGPMMTFHAGEEQVIKGITDEVIQNLVKKGLSVGHIVDSTGYTYTVTPFDSEGLKFELESMVCDAGCDILYHSVVNEVTSENSLITKINVLSCASHFDVFAKVFIDASGDGDLLYQSNIPFKQGRDSDGKDQPMSMNMKLSNVDIDKIRDIMDKDVTLFPFLKSKAGLEKKASRLSCSGFQEIMREGINKKEITFDRDIVLFFETNTKNEVIVNMSRVNNLNPVNPRDISMAEIEGRKQVWQLFSYLKKAVPGFKNSKLISTGPNIGIRSSRRLIGKYTLTVEDIIKGTKFKDGISACGYPIDIHSSDGSATDSTFLKYGVWYTIPYRCLINEKINNIISTGRIISSTFEAQASLRVSPSCGALGHASGVSAALCVKNNILPSDIDVDLIRNELKKQGAFLD
ncbi:MAG: FAD-dependent oxidoreductase [Spirochaetia bacterium]|nr:FAD-dependent oxidoreductase [Spirochaetia bacterium]